MNKEQSLYGHIQQMREVERKTSQIIMIAGYLNEEVIKNESINIEQFVE